MAKIQNTAFEVKVTNSKRNDTQNITGLFGYLESQDFVEDDCAAGFLCVKHEQLPNLGYESPMVKSGSAFAAAAGLKNANSWYMLTATNGLSGNMYGDHTGIYAANTYDVNKAVSGDLVVNVPGETLGLAIPAGERSDFTELMVGEMYNFAAGNFSTPPTALLPYAIISNGLLSATDQKPEDGSVYFQYVPTNERFTKGAYDAGAKYTMLCLRAPQNNGIIVVRAGTYNATTGEWSPTAPYSVSYNATSEKYVATGMIPYGPADPVFPNAPGYRFAVRITNKKVDSASALPSGIICKVTNTSVPGGYNEYTKAAFESDGSLINIFAPTSETLSATREIKIKWNEEEGFETYTFDLSGATLQGVYAIAASITNGSYSGATQILQGNTAIGTISAGTGYLLPDSITVSGASYAYDDTTGDIVLSNATGNVTISATCESETPTPSLTPFSVGQTIGGIDFGDVSNGDTSDAMDALLAGLTYDERGFFYLVSQAVSEDGIVGAMDLSVMSEGAVQGYVIATGSSILYGTTSYSGGGMPSFDRGYNNLTNGKFDLGTVVEVGDVSAVQGWNGVLIGAVEGEPTPAPTTYTITPSITNGKASGDNSIEENGTATVTISADTGYELPDSVTVSGASYTYDDTTGAISLSNPTDNVTISATCPAEQQGLTAIAVNDVLTSIGFDTSLTAQEVIAILDTLTYTDGVCPLVEASGTGTEETGHSIIDAYKTEDDQNPGTYNYGITVGTSLDGQSGDISYTVVFDANGFTNLTDGSIAIAINPSPVVTSVDATAGWNGVLIGK